MIPTPCGRRTCDQPASYGVVGSKAKLCSEHAARICDTDVVYELTGRVERLVAA